MQTSESKLKKDDRVIELGQTPGKEALTSKSMADPGLLKGTNQLHAVMNPSFGYWTLRYERGDVPLPLKSKFTSFQLAKEAAERYFGNKGLEVIRVVD